MASALNIAANGSTAVHECPDCGLFSRLAKPVAGFDMRCSRCEKILRRVRHRSLDVTMACALSALFFYMLALTSPFLEARLYDSFHIGTLMTGPLELDDHGFWELAAVVLMFTIIMPLIKVLGLILVLLELKRPHPRHWIAVFFGWLKHLNTWTMIEIYLLGLIVAYARLHALMQVRVDVATYALIGLMLSMVGIDASLDPETVWEEMRRKWVVASGSSHSGKLIGCDTCHAVCRATEGENCPRCNSILHNRKPDSLNRAWALTIAAAVLYIPSNYFPVMTVMKFGRVQSYTIFAGLREFVQIGMWPLALLVFTASIAIPLFKLLSLTIMLSTTQGRMRWVLNRRTQLYRVIDFIGRWSMVDIFMVSILVALVHFGAFVRISADIGAVYFTAVVILTMLAVECFDPRLMWDAAKASGHHDK